MGIGKMKKQTVCLFLSAILLFTAFLGIPVSAASGATVFQDVPNGMWYTNAVQYCNLIGLVSGYTDGTFRPDKNLTRAEMAVIMSKMLDLTEKSSNGFSDVQNGAWYTEPILKCVKAGVMSGYSGKKFGTNDTLTREQGAVILAKAFGVEKVSGRTSFTDDKNISSWAVGSVKAMTQKKLLSGMGNNAFSPKTAMTRAQMCQIIYAAYGKPDTDRPWKDAYLDFIENEEEIEDIRGRASYGLAYVDEDPVPELFIHASDLNECYYLVSYHEGTRYILVIEDASMADVLYEEKANSVVVSYIGEEDGIYEDHFWKIAKDDWEKVAVGSYEISESKNKSDDSPVIENCVWKGKKVSSDTYAEHVLKLIDADKADYFVADMDYDMVKKTLS